MYVIEVMAMVMEVIQDCYRIEAVIHVTDVIAMVMDFVIGLSLKCM